MEEPSTDRQRRAGCLYCAPVYILINPESNKITPTFDLATRSLKRLSLLFQK